MARDINFGSSEADAKYQISDDGTPGDFVLARDTNGATVLLQWNATAGQWEYGGPVDMDGNDLTDAGTTVYDASTDTVGDGTTSADHVSVTTEDVVFNGAAGVRVNRTGTDQSIGTADGKTTIEFDNSVFDDGGDFDLSTDTFTAPRAGTYYLRAAVAVNVGADGDRYELSITTPNAFSEQTQAGAAVIQSVGVSGIAQLSASDTVTVEFETFDSDVSIRGNASRTYFMAQELVAQ